MEIHTQIQNIFSNDVFQDYGIIGLFLNSFLSSTAIPLPTEILTSALLLGGESQILVGIALILGSSIGGVLNYFIGFGGKILFVKVKNKDEKKTEHKNKDSKMLDKFGWGAVFFSSWIPIIGDFILISAGVKKMNLAKFVIFMITGKTFKTIVVVAGLGLVF
ncbi:DedA family protein [Nitrosopumilus sp. K4]|uniref:YqaA family protein n=1 Tax=Nitrosopumilus sp. K4 TaxID=2795383 RepID=UPI001BAB0CA5|nr:VTT domain-containing protein [Nitrosopumilus sp. K4]QUC64021.1 DedA family protein [Nitrosopumilus sp. K4]